MGDAGAARRTRRAGTVGVSRSEPRLPVACRIAVLLSSLLVASTAAAAAESLPSPECVRELRRANVQRLARDAAGQLAALRSARSVCEGISALAGLLAFDRADREDLLPAAEVQDVRRQLLDRLEDAERPLSLAVAQQLLGGVDLDEDLLARIGSQLRHRLEDAQIAAAEEVRVLRVLADLEGRIGRPEERAAILDRLVELDPTPDVRWASFSSHRQLENWEQALQRLEPLLGEHPELRSMRVGLLIRAGRVEEVMEELDRIDGGELGSEATYLPADDGSGVLPMPSRGVLAQATQLAWILRDQERDAEAERVFRRIAAIDPSHQEARAALLHLYGTEEERAAFAAERTAARAAVSDPVQLINQGADLLAERSYGEAHAVFARVTSEFAGEPVLANEAVWYNFGLASYRTENWADAARALARATELNDGRAQSQLFLGMSLIKLERHAEAVPALQRAVELDPDQASAHYQLWLCYRLLGDETRAARHRAAYDALQEQP